MKRIFNLSIVFAVLNFFVWTSSLTHACTRALYVGTDNVVMTGRTMDWDEDMSTDLWLFPRGILRNGEAGPDSPKWESKYGSVVASVYGLASADGMNEKGLVMNLLYLAESDYGTPPKGQPTLSISLWGQYVLDNFSTVVETVNAFQTKPMYLIAPNLPNGTKSQVHLSISDPSGDSAIFEYIEGKQIIHHDKKYTVMTNSPAYDKQIALNEYWQEIGGETFLPGTSRAADRFARTSYYLSTIPKQIDKAYIKSIPNQSVDNQALAGVLSLMRANSVPFGVSIPGKPNIAATLWRSVSDQKNRIYYFDSSTRPNTFWVSFDQLDFNKGAPVRKLALADGQIYAGEVAKEFKPATAFQFMKASDSH